MEQSTVQIIGQAIEQMGIMDLVGGPKQVEMGLQQFQVELARIGLDVQAAKVRGIPLAQAVRDFDNYPTLARVHTAVADVLRWSMPPVIAAWARRFLANPEPPIVDELRTYIINCAARRAAGASSRAQCGAIGKLGELRPC